MSARSPQIIIRLCCWLMKFDVGWCLPQDTTFHFCSLSLSRFLFLSITKAFSFCRTKLLPFQVISQDLHLFQPSINLASWMFTEYFSGMQATIWFSVPPTISSSNICIGIIVFSQEATNKPLPRCRMDSGGFFESFVYVLVFGLKVCVRAPVRVLFAIRIPNMLSTITRYC